MPSDAPSPTPLRCPRCGAALSPGVRECWLCHADVSKPDDGESRFRGPHAAADAAPSEGPGHFSLASLMMFVTIAVIALGVFSIWRGRGGVLVIAVLIGLVHTVVIVRRREALGHDVTASEIAVVLLKKIIIAVLVCFAIAVALVVALLVACWVALSQSGGIGGGPFH
jgi:hypothetical protein